MLHFCLSSTMNQVPGNSSSIRSQKLLTILMLTSIVFLGSGFTLRKSSVAADKSPLLETANSSLKESATTNRLPRQVADAVLRDASEWSGLPTAALRIVKGERRDWGNECVFAFGSLCTAELNPISGWEVTVNSGTQQWVYHVDDKTNSLLMDRTIALEPKAAEVIKKDAAKFLGSSNLRIITLEYRRDWNGICEGIPNCTRPTAQGWQATVSNGQDSYVYRVKEDGSEFEIQGHNVNNKALEPAQILANELLRPWEQNVVFRAGQTHLNLFDKNLLTLKFC
jgi:hypothetical protein